jgi:RHS repeat-associated protein
MKKIILFIRLVLFLSIVLFSNCLEAQIAAEIPISYDVSPTGAFTYSVPLRIPPGVKDLVPSLAITYNSQSGNGALGMGWNINGLSLITRTVPTIFHNRKVAPVNFDNDDVFVLDGQRLFETSTGSHVYLTEIKNFAVIEWHTNNSSDYFTVEYPNGITYEYGHTVSSQLKVEPAIATTLQQQGKSDVITWAVNKIYDKNGNYIVFDYYNNQNNGDFRIKNIAYTGNNNINPPTEIAFSYSAKPDNNSAWIGDSRIIDSFRLDQIEITHSGNLVNKYAFSYDGGSFSHLISIQEIRPNVSLPAITVNWGIVAAPFTNVTTSNQSQTAMNFCLGDFNGDGATDYLTTPQTPFIGNNYEVFLSDKSDDFNSSATGYMPYTSGSLQNLIFNLPMFYDKIMFDYNGDGYDDIIIVNKNLVGLPATGSNCTIDLMLSNGDGTFGSSTLLFYSFSADPHYIDHVHVVPGNFDGDGKRELLILSPVCTGQTVTAYNCYLVGDEYPLTLAGFILDDCSVAFARDFDGDGKDELFRTLLTASSPKCELYKLSVTYNQITGKPSILNGLVNTYQGGLPDRNNLIIPGDFNGDGKSDLLTWMPYFSWQPNLGGLWILYYSTGSNFWGTVFPGSGSHNLDVYGPSYSPGSFAYHVGDFNGDGKDDILEIAHNGTSADLHMFYSGGNNKFDYETTSIQGLSANLYESTVGDFNGDGQADLLCHYSGNNNSYPKIVYFYKNDQRHLVTSITHAGSGTSNSPLKEINVGYQLITQDNEYKKVPDLNSSVHYPFITRQIPVKVVKDVNDNVSLLKHYQYAGMTIHTTGLGIRGFAYVWESDITAQRISLNAYRVIYPLTIPYSVPVGLVYKKTWNSQAYANNNFGSSLPTDYPDFTIYEGIPGNMPLYLSAYENAYFDGGANGRSTIVLPKTSIDNDFIKGINKTFSCPAAFGSQPSSGSILYNFGQVDGIENYTYDRQGNQMWHETSGFTYDANAAFCNKAKPIEVTVTEQRFNKPSYSRTTQYQYNSLGQLIKEKTDPGTSNEKTVDYYYSGTFGNLSNKVLTATGIYGSNITSYFYSSDGRFKTGTQNALGYTSSSTYDGVWGNVLTSTDINGFTTSYQYDAINRITGTTSPLLIQTTTTYDWADQHPDKPTFQDAKFVIEESTSGISGSVLSFFDVYHNKLREVSYDFNGNVMYQDTKYKSNGLVDYSTASYDKLNPQNAITTTFSYDNMNREIQRTSSSSIAPGFTTSYSNHTYSNYAAEAEVTVTNTSTGQNKVTYTNALGEVYRIEENTSSNNSNTLEYVFNSNGKIDNVNLNGNGTLYNVYDAFGRKINVIETNAGATKYVYNALDEVTTETRNNGNGFTYQYDVLGRVIQKTSIATGGSYQYYFNNSVTPPNQNTGKLTQETSPWNTQINYTYDPATGKVNSKQETDGTNSFTTTYSYDSYGRLYDYAYPTGDVVRKYYNNYGFMYQVGLVASSSLPLGPLWKINSKDILGKTTQSEYYQSGTSSPIYIADKTYNELGYPTGHKVTNVNFPNNPVVNMVYSFNTYTGNLNGRFDLANGWDETFGYDEYDRLTDAYDSKSHHLHLKYSNEGNVLQKSDVNNTNLNPPLPDWKYDGYALQAIPEPASSSPAFVIPQPTQNTTYWPENNLVKTVEEGMARVEFDKYNPDDERFKVDYYQMPAPASILQKTRFYTDNFERTQDALTNTTEDAGYVWADGNLVAILYHKTGVASQIYYPITDHLGSITQILDNNGTGGASANGMIEQRSFDAWGRPRDPSTLVCYNGQLTPAPNWMFDRGYTGHEHIWLHGLYNNNIINMNGRLYDPETGRMFSPDPYVVDNTSSQNFNKYSYVLNNPLKYTDPTGKIWNIIIGAVIGGVINLGVQIFNGNVQSFGDGCVAFGIGAAAGAVAGATGVWVGGAIGIGGAAGGAIAGAASGFSAGFITGTCNSWYFEGASLKDGLSAGLREGGYGAAFGGVIGGVAGGIGAVHGNRSFWTGKRLYPEFRGTMSPQSTNVNSNSPYTNNTEVTLESTGSETSAESGTTSETNGDHTDYLQKVASDAEDKIGGKGGVSGTLKHSECFRTIESSGLDLQPNYYFNDKGLRGFLDVYDPTNQVIYDFKFGNSTMSGAQMTKYFKAFPEVQKIIIIRPNGYSIITNGINLK